MPQSKTDYIDFQGKCKWVRTKGLNPWGKWTATLWLTPESLEVFRDLQTQGVKNHLKKDEDGYYVTFTRSFEKEYKDKLGMTRKIGFTPVEVYDRDGTPFDGLIGDGSDLTVTAEVYTHGTPSGAKAKAARLKTIRVDNLVPFTREDLDERQRKSLERLDQIIPQPRF